MAETVTPVPLYQVPHQGYVTPGDMLPSVSVYTEGEAPVAEPTEQDIYQAAFADEAVRLGLTSDEFTHAEEHNAPSLFMHLAEQNAQQAVVEHQAQKAEADLQARIQARIASLTHEQFLIGMNTTLADGAHLADFEWGARSIPMAAMGPAEASWPPRAPEAAAAETRPAAPAPARTSKAAPTPAPTPAATRTPRVETVDPTPTTPVEAAPASTPSMTRRSDGIYVGEILPAAVRTEPPRVERPAFAAPEVLVARPWGSTPDHAAAPMSWHPADEEPTRATYRSAPIGETEVPEEFTRPWSDEELSNDEWPDFDADTATKSAPHAYPEAWPEELGHAGQGWPEEWPEEIHPAEEPVSAPPAVETPAASVAPRAPRTRKERLKDFIKRNLGEREGVEWEEAELQDPNYDPALDPNMVKVGNNYVDKGVAEMQYSHRQYRKILKDYYKNDATPAERREAIEDGILIERKFLGDRIAKDVVAPPAEPSPQERRAAERDDVWNYANFGRNRRIQATMNEPSNRKVQAEHGMDDAAYRQWITQGIDNIIQHDYFDQIREAGIAERKSVRGRNNKYAYTYAEDPQQGRVWETDFNETTPRSRTYGKTRRVRK